MKFCVRIGEISKDPTKIRPLLIGFRDHNSRDYILNKTRFLANFSYKEINIILDLTARQRKEEDTMKRG